jgi:hypothetical protein
VIHAATGHVPIEATRICSGTNKRSIDASLGPSYEKKPTKIGELIRSQQAEQMMIYLITITY